nr:LuxR C-terminal-related transcriptional regulator [Azospirillum rugosum]
MNGQGAVAADDRNAVLPSLLGFSDLNPLDVQILNHLVDGSTNKQIAISLGLSEEMVKLNLMQIMRKINVRNRTQAALWTVQSGICRGHGGGDQMGVEPIPVRKTA